MELSMATGTVLPVALKYKTHIVSQRDLDASLDIDPQTIPASKWLTRPLLAYSH
jgi:hypothetical protein